MKLKNMPSQMGYRQSKIQNPRYTRPGTAMAETILVLPLLVIVLAMILYFGRGMVRIQRAQVMDRYETWRQVSNTRRVALGGGGDRPNDPRPSNPDNTLMNQAFFGGKAESVNAIGGGALPRDSAEGLWAAAGGRSGDAALLAQTTVLYLPWQSVGGFQSTHAATGVATRSFDGPIQHAHTRSGSDWSFVSGWRINSLDADVISRERYTIEVESEAETDPQRKTYFRIVDAFGRVRDTIVGDGAGGIIIVHDDKIEAWQRKGAVAGNVVAVKEVFYERFDSGLATLVDHDNPIARGARGMYSSSFSYEGPTVPRDRSLTP